LPDPDDPLAAEIERQRRELTEAQAKLLEQLRQFEHAGQRKAAAQREVDGLAAHRQEREAERSQVERSVEEKGKAGQAVVLSLAEIQERSKRLAEELAALGKAPSTKKALHYRVPISRALQTEELFLECRGGRVTVIDIGGLYDEIQRVLRDQGEKLRTRRQVTDVTPVVGAFQLRYVVERETDVFEDVVPNLATDSKASFRYGVSGWELEPVVTDRGETLEAALATGSAFRRVIDALDPHQTAVTLWVYPDSFPLYRKLRDYLHDRDVVVAGRPLPEGVPIASSKRGTASRGQ
jgi:hypothetical protein